jgi:hypothetical protein
MSTNKRAWQILEFAARIAQEDEEVAAGLMQMAAAAAVEDRDPWRRGTSIRNAISTLASAMAQDVADRKERAKHFPPIDEPR